jgi:hypothetical protein
MGKAKRAHRFKTLGNDGHGPRPFAHPTFANQHWTYNRHPVPKRITFRLGFRWEAEVLVIRPEVQSLMPQ